MTFLPENAPNIDLSGCCLPSTISILRWLIENQELLPVRTAQCQRWYDGIVGSSRAQAGDCNTSFR